ncbi:MAG: hypothetical protein M3024_11485 [Candidatus Dormibacteraeota bacterium]|nr:hypothetical protein [Candidatus Dormibacteraeota bacterium]
MSRSLPAAALGGLAALTLGACGGSPGPVSAAACPATASAAAGTGLRSLQATPAESSLRALVANAGPVPGRPYEIRWLADPRKAGRAMLVVAVRQGTQQSLRQSTAGTVSGNLAEFPTSLTFPRAGCWDVDATTGTAAGDIILRVG